MKAIVNVNEKWGIGRNGGLLCHIPEDMRFFRETTRDSVVVMGRKTLDSFPGKRPLKGRVNIVLTSDPDHIAPESMAAADAVLTDRSTEEEVIRFAEILEQEGNTALIATSAFEDMLALLNTFDPDIEYVIGGEMVYSLLLPYCDTCYVTKNDCTLEADSFFPNLDEDPEWELSGSSAENEHNGIRYCFTVYRRTEQSASGRTTVC